MRLFVPCGRERVVSAQVETPAYAARAGACAVPTAGTRRLPDSRVQGMTAVGRCVGTAVGERVGRAVVGRCVGRAEGARVGRAVGRGVGLRVKMGSVRST